MPHTFIVAANWKANGSLALCDEVSKLVQAAAPLAIQVVLFPPFLYWSQLQKLCESKAEIGVQNVSHTDNGPFTGEVTSAMLSDCRIPWCILGHSERRQKYSESDQSIHAKLRLLLDKGINCILCVGESHEQQGSVFQVLSEQLAVLGNLPAPKPGQVVIAYEPVWAIGSGQVPQPEQVAETHAFIKRHVSEAHPSIGDVRVLYGGSVSPKTCVGFLPVSGVDGFLIGGSSIKPAEFSEILSAVARAKK